MRNKILRQLKHIVIILSQYKLFHGFFLFLFKIQLYIILFVFKKCKGTRAIILRRKNVIEDGYPGESDFDITCIFAAEKDDIADVLFGLAKRQKWLKLVCPSLGETKFADGKDMMLHLKYNFINYGGDYKNISFLYSRNGFVLELPECYIFLCVYQMIYMLLRYFIWDIAVLGSGYSGNMVIFNRYAYKVTHKLGWLAGIANSQQFTELRYPKLAKSNFRNMPLIRNRFNQDCIAIIKKMNPIKTSAENLNFAIEGENELFPDEKIGYIQDALNPLISRFGELFDEIAFYNFRLYKFHKILVIKGKESAGLCNNKNLYAAIRKCSASLKPYFPSFEARYPLPLDDFLWKFAMSAEPVAGALYEHEHYDFVRRKIIRAGSSYGGVNSDALFTDIDKTLDIIYSLAWRERDVFYLLDLVFGHLMAYNLLLQRRIFYVSFDKLRREYLDELNFNKTQREIIDIYSRADTDEIGGMKTLYVWDVFKDRIINEINTAKLTLR